MKAATASLIQEVKSGANRNLQVMAAQGLLPLPPWDIIPLQVFLASSQDAEIAGLARQALLQLEPKAVSSLIRDGAPVHVLHFFALEFDHPLVLESVVARRDVPRSLLVRMASRLDPQLQEAILLRQDAILEEPGILDALESNPRLSRFVERRIRELREHLLPKAPQPEPEEEDVEEATDEEVQQAIAHVKQTQPAEEGKEKEEYTGLTDVQIRSLPVGVRMRLGRSAATRSLRGILVRDSNAQVALGCLRSSSFADQEIEQICHSRSIHEDVLQEICRSRQWLSKYSIISALVRNPKTPLREAMKFVPRLSVRDLRDLRWDRNVPDPIRQTARRLYKIKVN